MSLTLDIGNLRNSLTADDWTSVGPAVRKVHDALHAGKGKGSEFTGWLDLPSKIQDGFIRELQALAKDVQSHSDCIVSIGIGGSYLGIRSTIEFLGGTTRLPLYYAGHNMSSDYHKNLLDLLEHKRPTVVVISKSGTTTEPALAFRLIKKMMENQFGTKDLAKRIICVTDQAKGALRQIADKEGYRSFVIPDDVGGRFSVLTPVGLVPLVLAGVDIKDLVEGARKGRSEYALMDLEKNNAYRYAAARYLLSQKGKKIEVMSSFYPNMFYVAEWWKQLFGESEGKDGKGLFPASLILSTDLHSMGQMLQDGERNVFETFVMIDQPGRDLTIPSTSDDLDKFNYVAGKTLDYVNKKAYEGTAAAHTEGGCPNMTITLSRADAAHLGQLYYFFEKAVAISGYLLGVNPFDQPGVEAYKKKMFALLGKS